METIALLNAYLATLRAAYQIHQHNHWHVSGATSYSDHLLLQRCYESVSDHIDTVGEKLIGIFGEKAVDFTIQAKLVSEICMKYREKSGIEQSAAVEKDFCQFSKEVYDSLKKGGMTLGVDDMIMSICSDHETLGYLLGQRLK
jgi:DNA-binding ferritin-like protein